jgi:hypothetical protein
VLYSEELIGQQSSSFTTCTASKDVSEPIATTTPFRQNYRIPATLLAGGRKCRNASYALVFLRSFSARSLMRMRLQHLK